MKKKRKSRDFRTGRIDSAYAAGRPSARTRNVDTRLAIAELMKNGGKSPDSTVWNSSSVGVNRRVGGELAAWGSVFSASSHIHKTGKKKTSTTSQPPADHAMRDLIVSPPPGRWRRACAAQTWRR